MPSADYPSTVVEVLDDKILFRPATLRAVHAFAQSNPWRGSPDQRKRKFCKLNRRLAAVYGIRKPELVLGNSMDPAVDGATTSPVVIASFSSASSPL